MKFAKSARLVRKPTGFPHKSNVPQYRMKEQPCQEIASGSSCQLTPPVFCCCVYCIEGGTRIEGEAADYFAIRPHGQARYAVSACPFLLGVTPSAGQREKKPPRMAAEARTAPSAGLLILKKKAVSAGNARRETPGEKRRRCHVENCPAFTLTVCAVIPEQPNCRRKTG
jgi:hypothetical protein